MDRRFELVTSEAVDALTSGSKIGAIKIVRERSGLGLAEAKELVEQYLLAHPEVQMRMNERSVQVGAEWKWPLIFIVGAVVAFWLRRFF